MAAERPSAHWAGFDRDELVLDVIASGAEFEQVIDASTSSLERGRDAQRRGVETRKKRRVHNNREERP
jgi:hypothetical protein